jgi:hypothetical protein
MIASSCSPILPQLTCPQIFLDKRLIWSCGDEAMRRRIKVLRYLCKDRSANRVRYRSDGREEACWTSPDRYTLALGLWFPTMRCDAHASCETMLDLFTTVDQESERNTRLLCTQGSWELKSLCLRHFGWQRIPRLIRNVLRYCP